MHAAKLFPLKKTSAIEAPQPQQFMRQTGVVEREGSVQKPRPPK